MKIVKKDKGAVKAIIDSRNDAWYLYTIVEKGDLVSGDSEYKAKLSSGDEKSKVSKKKVWVKLAVEKTEFQEQELRISGSVVDGSEIVPRGSMHSLHIVPGYSLELFKERWLDYHWQRIDEATQAGGNTLVVLFDREAALFVLVNPQGNRLLSSLQGDVAKKGLDEQKQNTFYKEIAEQVHEYITRHKCAKFIAASPSFWKEYLRKSLSPDLLKKAVFSSVSTVDFSALPEVLRNPEVQAALASERVARETELIDSVLAALSKDRLAYGLDDLQHALDEGNISELVVSEEHIRETREKGEFDRTERLMRKAESIGAKIHVVSSETERVDGLGGIVGLKRW